MNVAPFAFDPLDELRQILGLAEDDVARSEVSRFAVDEVDRSTIRKGVFDPSDTQQLLPCHCIERSCDRTRACDGR